MFHRHRPFPQRGQKFAQPADAPSPLSLSEQIAAAERQRDPAEAPLWLAPQTPWHRLQAAYATTWNQLLDGRLRLALTLRGPLVRGAWPRSWRWRKVISTTLAGLLLSLPFQGAVVPPAHAAALTVDCTTTDLIAKINAANNETTNPGQDTLSLNSGCTYTLTAVDNW